MHNSTLSKSKDDINCKPVTGPSATKHELSTSALGRTRAAETNILTVETGGHGQNGSERERLLGPIRPISSATGTETSDVNPGKGTQRSQQPFRSSKNYRPLSKRLAKCLSPLLKQAAQHIIC